MAENEESVETKPGMWKISAKGGEEKKIPVFTVLKNNSILKNIFLIDSPPPGPSSVSSSDLGESKSSVTPKQALEEILVVGRHPDCNITLEHPSISRFHLRIHSVPSKQSLSVFDLSSVHGTWVCGMKIAPGLQVELHDGDVLQIGASSRIYRLHWIPLSCAYDYDDPFLPMLEESETLEEKEETHQNEEGLSLQPDDQSQMEADDLLFTNRNIISQTKQLTPSAPPMPEDMKSPFSCEEEMENKHPLHHTKSSNLQGPWQQDDEDLFQHDQSRTEFDDLDGLDLLFTESILTSEMTTFTTLAAVMHEDLESPFSCQQEAENKSSCYLNEIAGLQPVLQFDRENSISHHKSPENSPLRPELNSGVSIWKRRGKSSSVSVQTSRAGESSNFTHVDFEVKPQNHENLNTESVPEVPFASRDEGKDVFTPDKENCTPDTLLKWSFKKFGQEKRKHELSANSLTSCSCEDDEEAFTPDKENITPNTHMLRSLKKLEKLEEIRHPKTYRSSPLRNADSGIHQKAAKLGSSDEGNHANKLFQEKKLARSAFRGRAKLEAEVKETSDRVPFQSVLASPKDRNPQVSKLEAAIRGFHSINNQLIKDAIHPFHNTLKAENKKWTMVVDAACLLNKESRKALQLMQGLQGTSLIIPRIVIRELDCMKRRGNLFRRTTEVCLALEWIEDCMMNAQSWIHVQSSMEDVRPIAPTPPASPLSRFSQEIEKTEKFSIGSFPFSPCGSWLDIVSPTTEDHILECALLFRRSGKNGQLVLLSHDVTLKIKAMAEGLLCETAEEFRLSLVNPFSERFLWTDSSPRGPTWSCVDDVVLREKYYSASIQKQSNSGEAAKGLKLILLHNAHFRPISSVR